MASFGNNRPYDDEDYFSDTRMSFGDHIEDLRLHLWRAIIGFGIGLFLSFFIGRPVLMFIARPVEQQLGKFYERRAQRIAEELRAGHDEHLQQANRGKTVPVEVSLPELRKALGIKEPEDPDSPQSVRMNFVFHPLDMALAMRDAQEIIGRRPALTTLSVQEAFMVYFKVCILCGIVISSPWVFYQIWAFVAAGLYPHERKPVRVYLPFSLFLFLGGIALCEFVVLPKAIEVLLSFNEWLGMEPDLRLNEWLGFAIILPLIFGVSFQTPLVMFFVERIGLVSLDALKRNRRYALFFMAIFTAVVTPTPDALTMLFLWLPLVGLYELGLLMCRFAPRPPDLDIDVPESEDLIEV